MKHSRCDVTLRTGHYPKRKEGLIR